MGAVIANAIYDATGARLFQLPMTPATGQRPINTGDNAWLLASSALVLMMTAPGLILFYGGLVRRKTSFPR